MILATGYDYSWFILTHSIVEKEFALSGSEQNPDITEKDLEMFRRVVGHYIELANAHRPVERKAAE